jgi:hypothetical protein
VVYRKIESLRGGELEKELMGKDNGKPSEDVKAQMSGGSRSLAEEIVKHHNEGSLVYCRFGKQYVLNLEKQFNSLLISNTT